MIEFRASKDGDVEIKSNNFKCADPSIDVIYAPFFAATLHLEFAFAGDPPSQIAPRQCDAMHA